jgi:glucan phosphoethanolaminetransferase (alkaline phosphatase superfamily)
MGKVTKTALQRRIEIGSWAVLGISLIIGFAFFPFSFTLGILLGGLISILNFYWLSRDLVRVFQQYSDKAKPYIMIKFYIRFIVTGVIIFLVLTQTPVDLIGLIIGLSLIVINILLIVIATNLKNPLRRLKKKNASPFIPK